MNKRIAQVAIWTAVVVALVAVVDVVGAKVVHFVIKMHGG
jgi:hypothetical protein